LNQHAEQVRGLAAEFRVGLVDSLAQFKAEAARGAKMESFMSQSNHPNEQGHALIVQELIRWFDQKR
jgi:acyl-CoA thioesterase I